MQESGVYNKIIIFYYMVIDYSLTVPVRYFSIQSHQARSTSSSKACKTAGSNNSGLSASNQVKCEASTISAQPTMILY